jgi:chromosome segregation ATPase
MSKVINKMINKNKNKVQQRSYPGMSRRSSGMEPLRRGSNTGGTDDTDISDPYMSNKNLVSEESPRSIGGNSAEELFNQHRSKNSLLFVSYDGEGSLSSSNVPHPGKSSGSFASGSRGSKERSVGFQQDESEFYDLSHEPSEGDDDFGNFNEFNEEQHGSFNNSSSSNVKNISMYSDFNNSSSFRSNTRSKSVQRILQKDEGKEPLVVVTPTPRRSRSTGRSDLRERGSQLQNFESNDLPTAKISIEEPKRKSKMEKIFQLQEKNQRYKYEFRKVQKDRKAIKVELENKKLEVVTLRNQVETSASEITMLKQKLTSALQELDRTDLADRKDKSLILKLQKDLAMVRSDHNDSIARIARLREELESIKILLEEKDEKIESLTKELSEQISIVDSLHIEIIELKQNEGKSTAADDELKEENDRLQAELGETLERASSMVKEREDAIADLLKENEELKRMLSERDVGGDELSSALNEVAHIRDELSIAAAALEEAQDRNVLLEEDVEAWIVKKEEMESEIQRLNDEVEAWQAKTAAADRSMAVVETSAQESAKKVIALENALTEAEQKYKDHLQEQERRHMDALLDQKEKINQQLMAANEVAQPNPQELMLQKAVADRKAKDAAAKGSGIWGSVRRVQTGDADDELTADQKRIKELEVINADQEDEIKKTKSEMVKLRSTYNDTMYTNKKRIEQLEHEKSLYEAKQQAMEFELQELRREIATLQESSSGSTVASF